MRILFMLFACLGYCATAGTVFAAGEVPQKVFVSVVPQKYFVEQISGNFLEVEVMVRPGASPATYEPKPSQMRELAASAAYLSIGVPFEKAWLERITGVNPDMKLIATDAGIQKVAMAADHHHEEEGHGDHEDHGEIHEEGLDPHIWLSPVLVKKQVQSIAEGLTALYPEQEAMFRRNLDLFLKRIDGLDQELRDLLADRAGMKFMVFHPSWGYFAREYGLEQIAIEIEGKSPKPAQLKELIHHAREEGIRVIFAQPQFSTKSARLIAGEIDGKVLPIDPLAEDWYENMKNVAIQIRQVLQ